MGKHFVRAMLAMCVMALLTAGACIVKPRPAHRHSTVTHEKHKKPKKAKKPKKHAKKHKKHH